MTAFIIRRLLQAAFVVFAVVTLVFFLIRVSGEPASLGVNLDDFRSAEQIQAEYEDIRQRMGLDRHIMVQYGIFWYRAFQLNFGYSFRYGVPATRLIVERLPNSLRLGAVAAVIGIVVGLPLGVIAALNRGTIIDNLTTSVAVFGIVRATILARHHADNHFFRRASGCCPHPGPEAGSTSSCPPSRSRPA